MKNLVIGLGEVGQALQKVLKCDGHDAGVMLKGKFDVLHIAFPWSKHFDFYVRNYQEYYKPKMTIIHSSVPVGTSRKLKAVHSPIRGIHPHLEDGIRTFMKFFGGDDAIKAAKIFSDLGISTLCTKKSENTEAMKLWDTTIYGENIRLEKEIYKYCKDRGLDFEVVYGAANITYNEGYEKLGHPEYKKYVLKHVPGKIGGHCILPNYKLLKGREFKQNDE